MKDKIKKHFAVTLTKMPFAVGYRELFEIFQIGSRKCLRKNIIRKLYDKRTKPKPGGITVKSMKSSLQRERGGTMVL